MRSPVSYRSESGPAPEQVHVRSDRYMCLSCYEWGTGTQWCDKHTCPRTHGLVGFQRIDSHKVPDALDRARASARLRPKRAAGRK